jgi:hypothetical protein
VRAVNKSLRNGQFPTSFKAARIVAIHKGGHKLDPGNYRSIAVFSNLSKIFGGCYNAAIFIDVSKAFDCVDHSKLLTKLFRCRFRGVREWI